MNEVKQDITTVDEGIICHGVNCRRAMGSGVALAIKNKWPNIYISYLHNGEGAKVLGTCQIIHVGAAIYVANCYTQLDYKGYQRTKGYNFRNDNSKDVLADPFAIESSLNFAYQQAQNYELPLYVPRIGAGLGGLDWDTDVLPIIETLDAKYETVDTTICIWP